MTDTVDYCKTCYHPKGNHNLEGYTIPLNCDVDGCACEKYIFGETRTTSATGGQKGTKAERFSLVPVYPLTLLSRLYAKGAEKYAPHNWTKGYEWSKSYDSVIRHLTQFWDGEDIDPETGIPHVICAAFHCFALAQFMRDHPEHDDRYKPEVNAKSPVDLYREALKAFTEYSGEGGTGAFTEKDAREILGLETRVDTISATTFDPPILFPKKDEGNTVVDVIFDDEFMANLQVLRKQFKDENLSILTEETDNLIEELRERRNNLEGTSKDEK